MIAVGEPDARPPDGPVATEGDTVLRGLGASAGTYTGPARVIVREAQFEAVQPGEVLVCPQSSPAWTILFGRIGALVTDDGGTLSHSAIAAREFGLPAVLATRNGTRTLTTGQIVEVDGAAGLVRIVPATGDA
jgi:pyruvate,water dikinase